MSILDDASSASNISNNAGKKKRNELKEKLDLNKGVRDMHFEIAFDSRLREKANTLDTENAKKHYKVQKVCLSRIKTITIIIYYFVVPYFETPDWCLHYFKSDETPSVDGIFVPC